MVCESRVASNIRYGQLIRVFNNVLIPFDRLQAFVDQNADVYEKPEEPFELRPRDGMGGVEEFCGPA